jgi:hypothetical protein
LTILLAAGIGSSSSPTTTRRHECVAAEAGGVQFHSSTSGRFGERFEIVLAAPIGFQTVVVPFPGNAVQKFAGRFREPGARVGVEDLHRHGAGRLHSAVVDVNVDSVQDASLRIPVFELWSRRRGSRRRRPGAGSRVSPDPARRP